MDEDDTMLTILANEYLGKNGLISTVCTFKSLCNSWTDVVMSPCLITVFPGFSLFHSGLLHSLPKWSENGECLLDALGMCCGNQLQSG